MKDIVLNPGEYCVADAAHRIRTLLGSCVSIVLWHPQLRVGAMCHFLLSSETRNSEQLDGRYAEDALVLIVRDLAKLGVSAAACQAKLFGGSNMFPNQRSSGLLNIGQKNGETARRLVRSHGIPVASESLFGVGHRHIIFDVGTGNVWVRQTDVSAPPPSLKEPT